MTVEGKKGNRVPAWMVTFADLMALMMTFFALLYSFSKVDEAKYREVMESMARGFGAQWIKREPERHGEQGPEPGVINSPVKSTSPHDARLEQVAENTIGNQQALVSKLNQTMAKEIAAELITVVSKEGTVIIRFPDWVAFQSGSDVINDEFTSLVARVANVLTQSYGQIEVAGHTDNQSIATQRFRSNWELSTARAVSLVHLLLEKTDIETKRITVLGYADTRPLVPNNTPQNRAKNRRVEIVVSNLKLTSNLETGS